MIRYQQITNLKKTLNFLLYLIFYFFSAKSIKADPQQSALYFHIAAASGFFYGTTKEYVYDSGRKLSEIDWELNPVVLSGFSGRFIFFQDFSISTRIVMTDKAYIIMMNFYVNG